MSQNFTPNDVLKIEGFVKYNSGIYTAGQSGEYQVADLIVTVDMTYEKDGVPQPRDMDFKVGFFQDKCDFITMANVGDHVSVSCRVKANGYISKKNGKPDSFLKLDGFACEIRPASGNQPAQPSYQAPAPAPYQQAPMQQQQQAPAPMQQQQAPAPMQQQAPAPYQQQAPIQPNQMPPANFDQGFNEDVPF